ncbi:hypothetical protein DIPPA_35180 [Diplonema papillatum]|nr:hypothetical protein DIPPA_35180 [Diplonema papillatum]
MMKRRRKIAPTMSLGSLRSASELSCPPFFSYVVDDRLAACAELDPCTPGHISPAVRALLQEGVGGVIYFGPRANAALEKAIDRASRRLSNGLQWLNLGDLKIADVDGRTLQECVRFIEGVNLLGKSVVISSPNIGSTGSILAAYLIVSERKMTSEAVQLVRDRKPCAMFHIDKSADHVTFLLQLEWLCAAKEAVSLGLVWLRAFGSDHTDLLTYTMSFILPDKPAAVKPKPSDTSSQEGTLAC